MNVLASINRPEYIFRPTQILRRIACEFGSVDEYSTVSLPWGVRLRVRPQESIGSIIRRMGILDLFTSECIWRLLQPGEVAVDVGANVGHMTSLMAAKSGPAGHVIAVEPHPVLFRELQFNVETWRRQGALALITTCNVALSASSGTAKLAVPPNFKKNNGLSFLASPEQTVEPNTQMFEVVLTTLDKLADVYRAISFLKIDVEGHELQVLEGAGQLLREKRIKTIVFEEHGTPPTPVTRTLEGFGFSVFLLDGALSGPILAPIAESHRRRLRDAPNYLATLDPELALASMSKKGWGVYSS
jgi:FkbM family methyltransferase